MDNKQEKNGFSFTYSAREQAEIKRIRSKYTVSDINEDKMARLRRLDCSVTSAASTVSLIFGICGILTLGFGMSLVMTDLALCLSLSKANAMLVGIAVGIVGGILTALAYPIYNCIVRIRRKALAPEIIRLTDELLK